MLVQNEAASSAATAIRVFIAEDHRVMLWGLKSLVESARPRMEVAGSATGRDELLARFDDGQIDKGMVGSREEVADEFDHPRQVHFREPIEDVAQAVRWWGCFAKPLPPRPSPPPWPQPPAEAPVAPPIDLTPPVPFRAPPKPGRNDPCPCGSGKKYKKCCGA